MQYIEPYNTYIFTAEKIFVGQNLRLPAAGEFFRGSGQKRGGNETKNTFLTPLDSGEIFVNIFALFLSKIIIKVKIIKVTGISINYESFSPWNYDECWNYDELCVVLW
eukprot:UN27069